MFVWRATVVWRWSSWLRRLAVAANSASVSGKSAASKEFTCRVSVGMTHCQAVHGAAACRSSAEPTPTLPMRSGRWNKGNGDEASLHIGCDQKAATSVSKLLAWLLLHVHGEQVVDCLHFDACLIEFAQDGRDVLEAARGSAHAGISSGSSWSGTSRSCVCTHLTTKQTSSAASPTMMSISPHSYKDKKKGLVLELYRTPSPLLILNVSSPRSTFDASFSFAPYPPPVILHCL